MGNRMFAVAVLLTTSVMVAVKMQMMIIVASQGNVSKPTSCSPIQADSPDSLDASDNANPPPIFLRIII